MYWFVGPTKPGVVGDWLDFCFEGCVVRVYGASARAEAALVQAEREYPRIPFGDESVERVKQELRGAGVDPGLFSVNRAAGPHSLAEAAAMPSTQRVNHGWAPRKGPWRSKEYLAFVRSKPCAWCNAPAPTEASHHGKHGIGTKADDFRTIALCAHCHRADYHQHGTLGYMTFDQTREWVAEQIIRTLGEWVAR